jgi:DNA-binding NarL/FixJ family response regulator
VTEDGQEAVGAGHASSATDPIRVLVVDDHALFRRGVAMVLGQENDIEVVGEASDGGEAVTMATEATPDIVLMDVRMPRRGGIDATSAIKQSVPTCTRRSRPARWATC